MTQRDHWKKKRPAPELSERKSWLSGGNAGRGGAARQMADQQDGAVRPTQQGEGQR